MRRRNLFTILLVCVALLGAACGSKQKVGDEKLLNFQEQQNAKRLGEATAAPKSPSGALTVGGTQPTPRPTQAPTAAPKKQYFDVSLIANSPFYKPGNSITIRVGVTLRVTNADTTKERAKGRSFTDKAGTFNSGVLTPGKSWTWVFNQAASYEIVDEGLTFATARLEVVP
jgi:hypothetical protein